MTTSLQCRFRAVSGCPQGVVLSPRQSALLMDNLFTSLEIYEVEMQAYADDLVLLIIIMKRSEAETSHLLWTILTAVYHWCVREDVSINPQKMVSLPFSRK